MSRSIRVTAVLLLLAACTEPEATHQAQPVVQSGVGIAPDADLTLIPGSSLDFWVERRHVDGSEQTVWTETLSAPLFAGASLRIRATADRFPNCGTSGTVSAGMRLSDGQVVTVALNDGDDTSKWGSTTLPLGTEWIELWLKSERSDGCVEYDSRFGANYRYDVARWSPVVVRFLSDFTHSASGSLLQGGALIVDYDIQRLPNCRVTYRGYPNWWVKVWVAYDTGELYSTSIVQFDRTSTGEPLETYTVQRAAFPIPRGATSAQLWFENDQYPSTCHEWDSRFGENYPFAVVPAPADPCAGTVRWEGPTNVFPHCPSYTVTQHVNANSCQFYVDGIGQGSFSHNGASAAWLEAWLKVAPDLGTVMGAGMWARLADSQGVTQERVSFGVQTEPGTWKTGVTTARNALDGNAYTLQAQAFAFFVDVQQTGGTVERVWLSRGGENFVPEQVFALPGDTQTSGSTTIVWANQASYVFDQKRACPFGDPEDPEDCSSLQPTSGELYRDFDEVRARVERIFACHKQDVAATIKQIRPYYESFSDDRVFLHQNCGPASIGFQRVLLNYGMWTEIRTNEGPYKVHEYLLLRAPMRNGRYLHVIIDPTYRQYFRGLATRHLDGQGISPDDEAVDAFLLSDSTRQVLKDDLLVLKDERYLDWYYQQVNDGFAQLLGAADPYPISPNGIYERLAYPLPDEQMVYPRLLSETEIANLRDIARARKSAFVSVHPQLSARGTFNDWSAGPYGTMTLVDNYTWEIRNVTFAPSADARFKFDVNGDWSNNFGDNDHDGVAESFGADITVEGGKTYTITFFEKTNQYLVRSNVFDPTAPEARYSQVRLKGFAGGSGTKTMTLVGDYVWEAEVVFANDAFFFEANTTVTLGDQSLDGVADVDGAAVPVGSGTYVVRFHDLTHRYEVVAARLAP